MRRYILSIIFIGLHSPLAAQSVDNLPHISVELNAAETREQSCLLSFMITNGAQNDVEQAIYETVLFDADGQVERLTLFDFGALPAKRPRVRQFAVSSTSCENLSKVLFNGANTCRAESLEPNFCEENLHLISRTKIEVLG